MTSKTKLLKKGKYITGNAVPAPAENAEKKTVHTTTGNLHKNRNLKKEIAARSRARRMRSMLKLGMSKESIQEMFAQEDNRMVLILLNGAYTVQDGTISKTFRKRDERHRIVSVETKEVPKILRGYVAARKYVDDNKLHFMAGGTNAIWILSDKDHVDDVVKTVSILGRVSVTKPELHTQETESARLKKEKKSTKKPSNNTAEVKAAAKARRKQANAQKMQMRPYYAALRKGGVSARIKRYNPELAKKIEAWIKEKKAVDAKREEKLKEYRAKHRQLTSIERKSNKRARKAVKHLAALERRRELEKKRADSNAEKRAKRAQKAQKPVQTKIEMAA